LIHVRRHARAKPEDLLDDRLHRRVVKLADVRLARAAGIPARFRWSDLAGVPTPWQPKMPGASVRAKQRTERTELEPADMQFTGVFRRRHEPADIRSPEWNTEKPG